jgi:hypothetical protein
MGAKVSGRNSRLNGIVCHGYFEHETRTLTKPVWCSDTCGGPIMVDGTQDWDGKAMAYGHTPGVAPGELFQFEGMDSNGIGWATAAEGAMVTLFSLNVQCAAPDENTPVEPMSYELHFAGNGELATDESLTADEITVPTMVSGLGRAVKLHATVPVAVVGCIGWKFTIMHMPATFADSDVSGWIQRRVGLFNAMLDYRVNLDGVDNVPASNTDLMVQLPVTASTQWEVNWMRVMSRRPVYDHGSRTGEPKMVAMDVRLGWSSAKEGVRGYIKKPGGTSLWPAAGCT